MRSRSSEARAVLHYDGTPITARFIIGEIAALLQDRAVTPLREVAR